MGYQWTANGTFRPFSPESAKQCVTDLVELYAIPDKDHDPLEVIAWCIDQTDGLELYEAKPGDIVPGTIAFTGADARNDDGDELWPILAKHGDLKVSCLGEDGEMWQIYSEDGELKSAAGYPIFLRVGEQIAILTTEEITQIEHLSTTEWKRILGRHRT